jgi:myo-inositol catabolism protein IolS
MATVPTRPCGSSGLSLPALGLGCWAFGGGQYWGPQSDGDVEAVVDRALEVGMTYFDTAEAYNAGASESALGRALAGEGRRSRALVGTKISPSNTSPAVLRAHCEASLQRLRTDWIDLYLVHWPITANSLRHFTGDAALIADPPRVAEAFDTLGALRREGKIRHVGVSNFGVRQLEEAVATGVPLVVNELPYNLLMRAAESALFAACARHGMGVIGYMALMQGLLSGPFTSFEGLAPARARTRHFAATRPGSRHGEAGLEDETAAALREITAIAADAALPVSDLALAWALGNPAITCTIVGCRNLRQLGDNLRALQVHLDDSVRARLDLATRGLAARLGPSVDYYQGTADSRSE